MFPSGITCTRAVGTVEESIIRRALALAKSRVQELGLVPNLIRATCDSSPMLFFEVVSLGGSIPPFLSDFLLLLSVPLSVNLRERHGFFGAGEFFFLLFFFSNPEKKKGRRKKKIWTKKLERTGRV
jgi:hypothetical protein